ncbi:MAG: DUF4352 domain-containing protein [Brevinema sp.]
MSEENKKEKKGFAKFLSSKRFKVIGGIILALIILGNLGEGSSPDPTYAIGTPVSDDKLEVTITGVYERNQVGSQFFNSTPAQGGMYLVVLYQYKNVSQQPISMWDTPKISLVDSNGAQYKPDLGANSSYATEGDFDTKLLSDLNPGITVNDAEVFEISQELYETLDWNVRVKIGRKNYTFQ